MFLAGWSRGGNGCVGEGGLDAALTNDAAIDAILDGKGDASRSDGAGDGGCLGLPPDPSLLRDVVHNAVGSGLVLVQAVAIDTSQTYISVGVRYGKSGRFRLSVAAVGKLVGGEVFGS